MALLTGMTEDGREVPVQVDASGRLVAEGLPGPAGADGQDAQDLWTRTGTELSPKTAGDSLLASGGVKVGGTTAAPTTVIQADGKIGAGVTPLYPLEIKGGSVWSRNFCATARFQAPTSGAGVALGYVDGTGDAAIGSYGYTETVPTSLTFWTYPGGVRSEIHHRGSFTPTGDFLLGGTLPASPNITLSAAGNINSKGAVARIYTDNTSAIGDGLVAGDIYRKPDGTLMIAF